MLAEIVNTISAPAGCGLKAARPENHFAGVMTIFLNAMAVWSPCR